MSIAYRIYANDGAGGPVDYSTAVATTSGLTYATAALALGSDTTFAVRAYDTASLLEDQNVDARCRVLLDAAGVDITGRPRPISGLSAVARAGGTARVEWAWPYAARPYPTGFKVWLTAGSTTNFAASPAATVAFTGPSGAATLAGLADGSAYVVSVRAYTALADDGNTLSAAVTGDSTGPAAPTLTLTASDLG